ncbi:hypothetical protein KIPB_002065 [Kipferlia bialata]|uniref:Protein kinase domain-containing protein n=1 Tax=Kipferlia bialata TaxID=797122 RepID=A0A9K3CPV0_9EUKA|nr:hypothetical protein KIPB_002065 [Kipferlia bialata]|eukprot:g2065.t1
MAPGPQCTEEDTQTQDCGNDLTLSQIPIEETKRESLTGLYNVIAQLGSGSYGKVYKVQETTGDHNLFAAKLIDYELEKLDKYLRREVSAMKRTDSPHVVRYHDHFFNTDDRWNGFMVIVMELVEGDNLERLSTASDIFRRAERECAALGSNEGVRALAESKYPHLLPGNVFPNLLALMEQVSTTFSFCSSL